MLSNSVLTNEVCTAWSDAFFVLASNGTTVWLCLVKSVLHFPRWLVHRGDVVTDVLCVYTVYHILRREKIHVVFDQ